MRKNNNYNEAPLLMTSHGHAHEKQTFNSLKENRYQTTSLHVFSGKRVLGSAYGWLVLVGSAVEIADCCLWNPETAEKIKLPLLHNKPHLYKTCALSKPPNEPDCLVVFNTRLVQSVCTIGDDKFLEYSSIKTKRAFLVAMSSFRGEIYGILDYGPLMRYEFVTTHLLAGETVEFKPLLINDQQYWECPQLWRGWVTKRASYLVESPCGDLLLVSKMLSGAVVEFRVFRVDLNEMKCSAELDNIDGLTIFIAYYGKGFCCTSDTAGTKPNSIYYTEIRGSGVCVYDLDDRSTTELLPCPVIDPYRSVNYWLDLPAHILLASKLQFI